MSPELADFLVGSEAAEALEELRGRTREPELALLGELRRRHSPEQAGALLRLAQLRERASRKFGALAERLFFVEEALEQATATAIAADRAARIDALAPPGPILDLGCGIGGDLLALAAHRPVIGYERDPVRARFAAANAAACGLGDRVEVRSEDWTVALAEGRLPAAAAAFADPARREGGRRRVELEAMIPPLSALRPLTSSIPWLVVKSAPAIAALPEDAAVEFISHERSCKEALLWFGPGLEPLRRARVHRCEGGEDRWSELVGAPEARPPLAEVAAGRFVYEPDPAVIRARGIGPLAEQLGAGLVAEEVAYLVSDALCETPFAEAFELVAVLPYKPKVLRRWLGERGWGRVEVKKRGFPVGVEEVRRALRLDGRGEEGALLLTRRGRERLAMLARRRLFGRGSGD